MQFICPQIAPLHNGRIRRMSLTNPLENFLYRYLHRTELYQLRTTEMLQEKYAFSKLSEQYFKRFQSFSDFATVGCTWKFPFR